MKNTIGYIDKNNNVIDLFELEKLPNNNYKLNFNEKSKYYFLKSFSKKEYDQGCTEDQNNIKMFLSEVVGLKTDAYIKEIEDNFKKGISNLHINPSNKRQNILNKEQYIFEDSKHLLENLKKITDPEKTNCRVNFIRKSGNEYKAMPTFIKYKKLSESADLQAEYAINKTLKEQGYNVPESDLIYSDKYVYFVQKDFNKKSFQIFKNKNNELYGKEDSYSGDFNISTRGVYYLQQGKKITDNGDNSYLLAGKLLENYNNFLFSKIKDTEESFFLKSCYPENTKKEIEKIYQMLANNAFLGNYDMHSENISFSMVNNHGLTNFNSIELNPFFDIELHGMKNTLFTYFNKEKKLRDIEKDDIPKTNPAYIALNHKKGNIFYKNAKELIFKIEKNILKYEKEGKISLDTKRLFQKNMNKKGVDYDMTVIEDYSTPETQKIRKKPKIKLSF